MKKRIEHILFHRHLLLEFLRRDLEARYVGSAMGFFWSVVNPLILLAVYTVVFGVIFKAKAAMMYGIEDGGGIFAFYIFCGLLPWYAFQESLVRSTTCIVDNTHLIKQVRFPAKVLPAYITVSSVINQLIGTAIFLAVFFVYNGGLPWTVLALPLVLAVQLLCFFGLGLLFSTLNTYLRDIAPLVGIATMMLMWAAPMLYTVQYLDSAPQWIRALVLLNPVSYLVMIHHHLVYYGAMPPLHYWLVFGGFSLLVFAAGYRLFTRCHHEFADML